MTRDFQSQASRFGWGRMRSIIAAGWNAVYVLDFSLDEIEKTLGGPAIPSGGTALFRFGMLVCKSINAFAVIASNWPM